MNIQIGNIDYTLDFKNNKVADTQGNDIDLKTFYSQLMEAANWGELQIPKELEIYLYKKQLLGDLFKKHYKRKLYQEHSPSRFVENLLKRK